MSSLDVILCTACGIDVIATNTPYYHIMDGEDYDNILCGPCLSDQYDNEWIEEDPEYVIDYDAYEESDPRFERR